MRKRKIEIHKDIRKTGARRQNSVSGHLMRIMIASSLGDVTFARFPTLCFFNRDCASFSVNRFSIGAPTLFNFLLHITDYKRTSGSMKNSLIFLFRESITTSKEYTNNTSLDHHTKIMFRSIRQKKTVTWQHQNKIFFNGLFCQKSN